MSLITANNITAHATEHGNDVPLRCSHEKYSHGTCSNARNARLIRNNNEKPLKVSKHAAKDTSYGYITIG